MNGGTTRLELATFAVTSPDGHRYSPRSWCVRDMRTHRAPKELCKKFPYRLGSRRRHKEVFSMSVLDGFSVPTAWELWSRRVSRQINVVPARKATMAPKNKKPPTAVIARGGAPRKVAPTLEG